MQGRRFADARFSDDQISTDLNYIRDRYISFLPKEIWDSSVFVVKLLRLIERVHNAPRMLYLDFESGDGQGGSAHSAPSSVTLVSHRENIRWVMKAGRVVVDKTKGTGKTN